MPSVQPILAEDKNVLSLVTGSEAVIVWMSAGGICLPDPSAAVKFDYDTYSPDDVHVQGNILSKK